MHHMKLLINIILGGVVILSILLTKSDKGNTQTTYKRGGL